MTNITSEGRSRARDNGPGTCGSAPGSSTSSSAEAGSPRKSWPSLSISSSRNSGLEVPAFLQVGDDLARQRADVGPAVAADLGLVAHAAQRLARELAPGRPGDRPAERGLADARRADEAQDRPLELVGPRLDREIFDDPVLDLLERVMVLVEHRLRLGDVLLERGSSCPTAGRAARRGSCARRSPRRSSAPSPSAS